MLNRIKTHYRQRQMLVCSSIVTISLIASFLLTGGTAPAGNVLANASMESGLSAGWTAYGRNG